MYNLGLGAEQRPDVLSAGRFRSEKRNFGGETRSPVDCIKSSVASLPAVPKTRACFPRSIMEKKKTSFDDKNKESINASRESARLVYNERLQRTTREGEGSASETRGRRVRRVRVFRIMKDVSG